MAVAIGTSPAAAQTPQCFDAAGNIIPCTTVQPPGCDTPGYACTPTEPGQSSGNPPPANTATDLPVRVITKTPPPTMTATPTITTTATPVPCNAGGSSASNRPDCTPTPTPPCLSSGSGLSARPDCSPTPTPPCYSGSGSSTQVECTRVSTPKPQALLVPGGGTGPNNPGSLLPAIQNLGPLGGGLLAGLIIVIVSLGGFFLVKRGRKLGSTGGSDLLPAIQRGGLESATISVTDGADLGGGLESATMSVHDIGNVSPDGTMRPPGPPVTPSDVLKPPGPPTTPSDVLKPPGPPNTPSDVLKPPGPPITPSDVLKPPGPPVRPSDVLRPPGPPIKPSSSNLSG
jgi:hypothetical protein